MPEIQKKSTIVSQGMRNMGLLVSPAGYNFRAASLFLRPLVLHKYRPPATRAIANIAPAAAMPPIAPFERPPDGSTGKAGNALVLAGELADGVIVMVVIDSVADFEFDGVDVGDDPA